MKKNYYLAVIQAAVVNNDFEFDAEDSIMQVFGQAEDSLREDPIGVDFVRTELSGHGMSQAYTFYDDATGFTNTTSGEIFDWGHYRADNETYFKADGKGGFDAVNWFDIPEEGNPERRNYIYVFDREVQSNGRLAYLYDYFE